MSAALRRIPVKYMVLLGVILMAIPVATVTAKRQKVLERGDRRFDHEAHEQLVKNKLGKGMTCNGVCHTMSDDLTDWKRDADDKKEHERCYKACHGGFRHRYTTSRGSLKGITGRTCFPCHGEKLKYRPKRNNLGQVAGESKLNYAATYSHRQHTSEKAKKGQCEQCHGRWGDQAGSQQGSLAAGHPFCGACHARVIEPTMDDCQGCHLGVNSPRGKVAVKKARPASPYAVSGAFSHKSHANLRGIGADGRTCLTCHNNIAKAKEDAEIPLPSMQLCYDTCHDGKKAFSVTGTKCTQCHRKN